MTIEVIIPNYNGFNLVESNFPQLLNSLSKYKDKISITISDDGSTFDELEKLENYLKHLYEEYKIKINLIKNSKNMGFSSAINNAAFKTKADILVFINTDVVPEKNFLDPIINDFKDNDLLFGVGCLDKSIEGKNVILRGRGVGFWKKGFLIHKRGDIEKRDTLWISGGSCVVRRDIFLKLNGFDELYNPFYWEDIDLSYRAQKAGYKIMFEKESKVIHRHQEGTIKKHYSNSFIRTIAYRNQFIFIWKNITDKKFMLSHVFWLPYHLFKALFRLDVPFFEGLISAVLKLNSVCNKRKLNKKIFTKTDVEILKKFND